MKPIFIVGAALVLGTTPLAPRAWAQANESAVKESRVDGSELQNQLLEREGKISKLTLDEQLILRAAQVKAAEDPDVKAALEKRDQAIAEFRTAMHNSIVKSDPRAEPILQKIAIGTSPGF